jgi:hypothetical protein
LKVVVGWSEGHEGERDLPVLLYYMIDESVDKRKRKGTRDSKLLGCSITVAQIKILSM